MPSSCQMKIFCDVSQSCRCLKAAEGDIRCGMPPSCEVKQCTKSSDCADLGPDFFCDSPQSGCCGDNLQRCIAPCKNTLCPAARICAGKCCAEGESCVAGACVAGGAPATDGATAMIDAAMQPPATPVDGTWTGSVASPGATPVGIRFVLTEQNGRLTGRTYVEDPNTKAFLVDAELNGTHTGAMASWTTATDLVIRGTFGPDGFTGTLTYPGDSSFPAVVSNITLKR